MIPYVVLPYHTVQKVVPSWLTYSLHLSSTALALIQEVHVQPSPHKPTSSITSPPSSNYSQKKPSPSYPAPKPYHTHYEIVSLPQDPWEHSALPTPT